MELANLHAARQAAKEAAMLPPGACNRVLFQVNTAFLSCWLVLSPITLNHNSVALKVASLGHWKYCADERKGKERNKLVSLSLPVQELLNLANPALVLQCLKLLTSLVLVKISLLNQY